MKMIETKYHGEIGISQEDIFTFPKGILAFEEEQEFILLPLNEESPFSILQSVKNPLVAFITIDVFGFFPAYDFEIHDLAIQCLQLKKPEQVVTLGIVTLKDPFEESTVNLYAPVILNKDERLGKQLVLEGSKYDIRTPFLHVEQEGV